MLDFKRTGRMSDVIAEIRDTPVRAIPYAASTALSRVAKLGESAILAEMPKVFDRPTAYTLRSTRTVPATVKNLAARVAVKDQGSGTLPEDYLFPEVFGGPRKEKRFERAMRYAGVLRAGERAVLGQRAPVDAAGNLLRSELSRVLAITATRPGSTRRSKAKRAEDGQYFAGEVRGQRGVWKRDGKRVSAVLIFTRATPRYRKRLDFEGIAQKTAETEFRPEFLRALQSINSRWSS